MTTQHSWLVPRMDCIEGSKVQPKKFRKKTNINIFLIYNQLVILPLRDLINNILNISNPFSNTWIRKRHKDHQREKNTEKHTKTFFFHLRYPPTLYWVIRATLKTFYQCMFVDVHIIPSFNLVNIIFQR